jgi:agmatine/peptidylarginine deiminase
MALSSFKNNSRLPAEWEPQDGVILVWPHDQTDWRNMLSEIESLYLQLASAIAQYETPLIVCRDESHLKHVKALLEKASSPQWPYLFIIAPSNDSWVRDYGPLTLYRNGEVIALDFSFNAWGGKYRCKDDRQVTQTLLSHRDIFRASTRRVPEVLEGGAIESDGKGTLLCTTSCLLSPSRNPYFSRDDYLKLFQTHFGTERILWLEHGYLPGDDTDGHIDTLARFCDPNTIAYVSAGSDQSDFSSALRRMESSLQAFRTVDQTPYRLVPLPPPPPLYDIEGERLPASYANFLIINDAVLYPIYQADSDEAARVALASCFPDRTLIPIDCRPAVAQYGSLHCLTMQLPKGALHPQGENR